MPYRQIRLISYAGLAAGFPSVNPYMTGFSPVMNPFLAMGRGPFDPLMAWYMAHYGTTGLMPGLGFTGRQVRLPAASLTLH